MMKSFFKKLAFMMALAMVISLAAPAAQASAAEAKKFTYAYQKGGKVTSLRMEVEDEVDLCFKGVKDYANYAKEDFDWRSTDEDVVTVDNNGVVTAVGNGIAQVYLKIKNSNYTSDYVKVVVGEVEGEEAPVVVLGVSKDEVCEAGEAYELPVGTLIDLKFFGVENFSLATYSVEWVSSNPDVIAVSQKGEITAVAEEGEAEISVVIVNKITEETLAVEPATFVVVPAVEDPEDPSEPVELELEAKQTAVNKVAVTFSDASAATTDVKLYMLNKVNDETIKMPWPCTVTVKDGVATVESLINFVDGDQFLIEAAGETVGFTAFVGDITRIEVVAKTGDKTACYVNEPIEFVVSYFAGDIKVDAAANSWVTFEALDQNDNIYIDGSLGKTSYIYVAGAKTNVKATYNYYDKDYNVQTLSFTFEIVGENKPVELYKGINNYAITNIGVGGKAEDVKWGTTDLVIGDTGYMAALNVGTTTGGVYSVNTAIKDKTVYDTAKGEFTFKSSNEKVILVGPNGSVTGVTAGSAYVIVEYAARNTDGTLAAAKAVYAIPVTVKAARTATNIKLSATSVTVLTKDNENGALTTATVTYEVFDQYWAPYNVSAATAETAAKVGEAAKKLEVKDHENNKGTIVINGANYASENVGSVAYTVAIPNTNVKTNLTVIPKKPATTSTGGTTVVTTGYLIDGGSIDINVKAEKLVSEVLYNTLTVYTTWSGTKTGYVKNIKTFAYDDFFTKNKSGLAKDDIVVKITGPDGKLVTDYTVVDGKITFKVADMATGSAISAKATGFYNVNLYSVTNVTMNNDASATASATALIAYRPLTSTSFEIKNTTLKTTVKSLKTGLTSDKATVEEAVLDIVTFQFNGGDIVPEVVKVNGTPNKDAKKCYVESVVVKTYINDTQCYFEETLAIGEVFNMPNMQ